MQLDIYQVDAFTHRLFHGNAAAVVPLTQWLTDQQMLQIAAENNLSETAFVLENSNGVVDIRWFSPLKEIDFCGHATLAAATVLLKRQPTRLQIDFQAAAVGRFSVKPAADGWLQMNFPQRPALPVAEVPAKLLQALGQPPVQILQNSQAWFAIFADAATVQHLTPDLQLLKQLAPLDLVVTAPGAGFADQQYDFISRYFWPANGGDEDPVTGSIHTGLVPYWAQRLGKTELLAYQASQRGGVLKCQLQGERVLISGQAVLYLQGSIFIE